ncbi:hypothetical protein SISSUDRAFT_1064252 [Sistotremastrum suecicum HHB10207 ss-3]|uniref:Uncharacterized protein n=1 Tax=Sistotremastrum suecicum HHB10207 ss-3 TaxID=1314776 RepID=A0A166AV74_9AGAM|nr:hypothetical protein SISSUDRAFT_1064252 [Sistotremastrum suecicum HHB10207 ss-3]
MFSSLLKSYSSLNSSPSPWSSLTPNGTSKPPGQAFKDTTTYDPWSSTPTAPKSIHPELRNDIYSLIDLSKPWLSSSTLPSTSSSSGFQGAGDGVSYSLLLPLIVKHFPGTSLTVPSMEVEVIVGGITNCVFELGKWDGMAGVMAMRTWVEALKDSFDVCKSNAKKLDSGRKEEAEERIRAIGEGIVYGVNHLTDPTLVTKEFAPRVQIYSLLKQVATIVYGKGAEKTRQAEALWSSRY